MNRKYALRTDVDLIGTAAIKAAEDAIKALDPRDVTSLNGLYEYNNKLREAIQGVASAAETANQPPDEIIESCVLTFTDNCVSLVFNQGFEPVNTCSFLCFPQPVLILVMNHDTGGSNQGLFNFVAQPEG